MIKWEKCSLQQLEKLEQFENKKLQQLKSLADNKQKKCIRRI